MASCTDCTYSTPDVRGDDFVLECRRFPPQVFVVDGNDAVQAWPNVGPDDWCGEHHPNEATP